MPGAVYFWAKTTEAGEPGISVHDHCLNVGAVAEAIIQGLPEGARALLPQGAAALAALHDVGKITPGFQCKCELWLAMAAPALPAMNKVQAQTSESDHALVSQAALEAVLKPGKSQLWGVALGAHHGRVKGKNVKIRLEEQGKWFESERHSLISKFESLLGPLPSTPPDPKFGSDHSDLWFLSGLISVADWIGSNEAWFPPDRGLSLGEARLRAREALGQIGWPGGGLKLTSFREAFADGGADFEPNALQRAVEEAAERAALLIVEGPMGCGKTEAALRVAQRHIASGWRQGLYFALPTQVTSNRIHRRIAKFLGQTLAGAAPLRLAHGNAWMDDTFDLRLRPSHPNHGQTDGDNPVATAWDGRSWFASAKQALLAAYGVGTIDQALQGMVAVRHFFVRRFALAGKVVVLDEVHSYDVYTGSLVTSLVRELVHLRCTVVILSATLTGARRRELLEAAGAREENPPSAYPLVTAAAPGGTCRHIAPQWGEARKIMLRAARIPEADIVGELVARASEGQHVLWIRNTVREAQAAWRMAAAAMREGAANLGLLHARFPFARRSELEEEWLGRLGKDRPRDGLGSLLVATQVVEQSVDIDLDHMVSDLAPSDMLLQRMGRLWRHPRGGRKAPFPEFTLRLPELPPGADAAGLKRALGLGGKVYAPYVLLRALQVWQGRTEILLPADIRALIEETYREPESPEPEAWAELREALLRERKELALNAEAATRVLGRPALEDREEILTRRQGPPTTPLLLLRDLRPSGDGSATLVGLDGSSAAASRRDWSRGTARFIHQWTVRVPSWMAAGAGPRPEWLALHGPRGAKVATVGPDGRCLFDGAFSTMGYNARLGVFEEISMRPTHQPWNHDDDEFDH